MITKWFQGLQEFCHQFSGEEMCIGSRGCEFVLIVVVGQGDAVRNLDTVQKS